MGLFPWGPGPLKAVERWVEAGQITEAAAALGRAAAIEPRLIMAARAAALIQGSNVVPEQGTKAFRRLLKLGAVSHAVADTSGSDLNRLRRVVEAGGLSGLVSPEEALIGIADGIVNDPPEKIRPFLGPVVAGGSLGPLALTLEHRHGGFPRRDYESALGRLAGLEEAYVLRWKTGSERGEAATHLTDATVLAAREIARLPEQKKGSLFVAADLAQYLQEKFPRGTFRSGAMPRTWTDFLLKRVGRRAGEGYCSPAHGLFAHLFLLGGRTPEAVLYHGHVNVHLPRLDLVVEVMPKTLWSRLGEWRSGYVLGDRENPAPPEAFLSAALVNLQGEGPSSTASPREFLGRAALNVYPDWSAAHILTAIGLLARDPAEVEVHLRRARHLHPQNPLALLIGAFHGWITGRSREALQQILDALWHEMVSRASPVFMTPAGWAADFKLREHTESILLALEGGGLDMNDPEVMEGAATVLQSLHIVGGENRLDLVAKAQSLWQKIIDLNPTDQSLVSRSYL